MANKITKDDLRSPDAFQKTMEQSYSFMTRYGKLIVGLLAALVLVAIALLVMDALSDRKETKATAALYQPQRDYKKIQDGFQQAKTPAAPGADPKAPKPVAASGDLQKDYGSVIPGLEKVVSEHSGTVAAGQAAAYLAAIYQEYGKLDEAKAVLEKPLKDAKGGTLIHAVLHMMQGNILASQDNCKEAVTAFQRVENFLSVDASVKAGVCYEKLGQFDQAAAMYRKASTETDSSSSLAAKGFLRALEQKRQTQQPAQSGQAG